VIAVIKEQITAIKFLVVDYFFAFCIFLPAGKAGIFEF